jgi:DNA-directed RNA polymerase subunit H (RpoH/RPB5)
MENTNQQLFTIYENIPLFYEYRQLVSLDERLNRSDFVKKMEKDKYLLMSAVANTQAADVPHLSKYVRQFNEKSSVPTVEIFHLLLIYPGTDCESKSMNMMKFVNHIRYPKAEVMIITPSKLSNSVLRKLNQLTSTREHQYHSFSAYTYNLLSTVIPHFELAPLYEIVEDDSSFNKDSLPKIFENDPQMVWIGAKVGHVIKLTFVSETTLLGISHRVVIPALT